MREREYHNCHDKYKELKYGFGDDYDMINVNFNYDNIMEIGFFIYLVKEASVQWKTSVAVVV